MVPVTDTTSSSGVSEDNGYRSRIKAREYYKIRDRDMESGYATQAADLLEASIYSLSRLLTAIASSNNRPPHDPLLPGPRATLAGILVLKAPLPPTPPRYPPLSSCLRRR